MFYFPPLQVANITKLTMRLTTKLLIKAHFITMSTLHEAASLGDADLLEDGLVKGLDPDERDCDWGGRTPLHIASSKGDKTCVLLLLQYDAE